MNFSKLTANQRFILAVFSGATVYPVSFLEKYNSAVIYGFSLIDCLIGAGFAILVMVPFMKSLRILRALLMILASILIYKFVSNQAISNYHDFYLNLDYDMGIIVSGGLGAVLSALTIQLLAPVKIRRKFYGLIALAGFFGGFIFTYTYDSQQAIINTLGFVAWQSVVCVAILLARKLG